MQKLCKKVSREFPPGHLLKYVWSHPRVICGTLISENSRRAYGRYRRGMVQFPPAAEGGLGKQIKLHCRSSSVIVSSLLRT